MQNKYNTNFDLPDAYFEQSSIVNDAQVKKVWNPKSVNEPIKTKTENIKIEPNPAKDRAMHDGELMTLVLH